MTAGSRESTGALDIYAGLVRDQIEEERLRKRSLEQRGVFVITSSSAFATLLLGLTTFGGDEAGLMVVREGRDALIGALIALVVACVAGLATNLPISYKEPTPASILEALTDPATVKETKATAVIEVGRGDILILRSHRQKNAIKAWLLTLALAAEAIAATLVSWVVYIILSR